MPAHSQSAMPLALTMLIVFASAKLLAELLETFGQPGIVGEILAGVVIGPGLLGLSSPDWIQPDGVVASLGDLGVMFLLFRAGLEIKSSELFSIGAQAALVAAGGVVSSLLLASGVLFLWNIHSMQAIFASASLAATSVGISGRVLSSRGLLHRRASQVILAAAVIDDIFGLLVLAVVSGMARGTVNVPRIAATSLLAIAFVLLVARWGPKAMQHLIPRAGDRLRLAEAEFALSMCLLFGLALVSTYTGIAAIVGAFLAGMALAESVGARVRTLVQGATELLVPFFLVGIGLRVDLAALRSPATMVLALALFCAALISKIGGCGLGALSMGRAEAFRVGAGMIPRGEVTMVVAQLGLTIGVITQGTFAALVAAAVATTLAAPPLIELAFRGEPRSPAAALH